MPAMTRVVLAEDEVLLREGLVGLLTRFDYERLVARVVAERQFRLCRGHPAKAWVGLRYLQPCLVGFCSGTD